MADSHPSARRSTASQVPGSTVTEVRLEMRSGQGRSVVYEVAEDAFVIGSVPGCDLRLPGSELPPIVCLIAHRGDQVNLRKLAPAQPLKVNGQLFAGGALADGDCIAIGGTEVAVNFVFGVEPYTSPLDVPATATAAEEDGNEPSDKQLASRQRLIDERFQALEAEQRSWQLRRQEMELEQRQFQTQQRELAAAQTELAKRRQEFDLQLQGMKSTHQNLGDQAEQLKRKQAEIESIRQELAKVRQELYERYRERRDRLAGVQEAVSLAARKVQERKRLIDVEEEQAKSRRREDEARRAELDARAQELEQCQMREWQLAEERAVYERHLAQYHEDLVRFERSRATLEEREQKLQQQADKLQREQRDQEEQGRQLQEWYEKLGAEADEIAQRRSEGEGATAELTKRIAALESQQATLATLRSRLEQLREELRHEEQQLAEERARQETLETDLRRQAQETQRLRAAFELDRDQFNKERQEVEERTRTLAEATLRLKQMQETLSGEEQRQRQRALVLDAAACQQVEEANLLQVRNTQMLEMQERLNSERQTLREREAALLQSEQARQLLQEQLRRRADELSERQKALAEQARQRDQEMNDLEARRIEMERERTRASEQLAQIQQQIADKSLEFEQLQTELAKREDVVQGHVERLKEAGRSIGQARKSLAEERAQVEAERQAAAATAQQAQAEIDAIRTEVLELQKQLPDFELRAQTAAERLAAAREQLCEHLDELHAYARQRREDLEGFRAQIIKEAQLIQEQALALHRARDEHRLSVAGFRQQIIAWQGQLADLKRKLAHDETRLERRQAEVHEAERVIDETSARLAKQAEQLQEQESEVAFRRDEVDRHLADMREWYRRKLRELAAGKVSDAQWPLIDAKETALETQTTTDARPTEERDILALTGEIDPGDRGLGDLLRTLELVDADTLTALLVEARRQRRSLRQVLLASGHVTLYQMALIEAGNVDGLMLGPVRVVDRLRMTPRETIYRVCDPRRGPTSDALLRHLAEAEMQVADHADDFRRRFTSAVAVQHVNLAATYEVLDIAGRPAALQEWLNGLAGTEWSDLVAVPGVCYRLLSQAALGLQIAHEAGLVHGRLSAAHLVLTTEGLLKIAGFGEPVWLNPAAVGEGVEQAKASDDLLALGRIAAVWLPPAPKTKGSKTKSPARPLMDVIQRLTADDNSQRLDSAVALLEDLDRLGGEVPANAEAWDRLLRVVREQGADEGVLRQSA